MWLLRDECGCLVQWLHFLMIFLHHYAVLRDDTEKVITSCNAIDHVGYLRFPNVHLKEKVRLFFYFLMLLSCVIYRLVYDFCLLVLYVHVSFMSVLFLVCMTS